MVYLLFLAEYNYNDYVAPGAKLAEDFVFRMKYGDPRLGTNRDVDFKKSYLCAYSPDKKIINWAFPRKKSTANNYLLQCYLGAASFAALSILGGPHALISGASFGCLCGMIVELRKNIAKGDEIKFTFEKPGPTPLEQCNTHCNKRRGAGLDPGEHCKEVELQFFGN